MKKVITSEMVVAYSLCPRKAYLLFQKEEGVPHAYETILNEQRAINQKAQLAQLQKTESQVSSYSLTTFKSGNRFLISALLKRENWLAYSDILTKTVQDYYEPTLITGTYTVTKAQKTELVFSAYVLGLIQGHFPTTGTIISLDGKAYPFKLKSAYKDLERTLGVLKDLLSEPESEQPPIILNKHCSQCPFQEQCRQKAERDNSLGWLDRMTPKALCKYHEKGIFTVNQLSYFFKPDRRKRKRRVFNYELQALAIRTGKIYIQEAPVLDKNPIQLFLDIEGVPDRQTYYLIGLLVFQDDHSRYHAFWADHDGQESEMWNTFLRTLDEYPDVPVYHYGTYEVRAINHLSKRYDNETSSLKKRLVNINSFLFGRLYFPVNSNNLKVIGQYLGATWSSPNASGLQSLVWRNGWEKTKKQPYKTLLLQYNQEDCLALRLLTQRLFEISESAKSDQEVDFAHQPKQGLTPRGLQLHQQLEHILRYAHADYKKKRISVRDAGPIGNATPAKKGPSVGHPAFIRKPISRSNRAILVPRKRKCPKHSGHALQVSDKTAEKSMIDLRFTKSGCSRVVITYQGKKAFCDQCKKDYDPPMIAQFGNQIFCHNFKVWVIYQRIVLRLPYRIIVQVMEELFQERISEGSIVNFIQYFSDYYAPTEKLIIQSLLESPFIHADETRINIQGESYQVWVLTNGTHVFLKMTETREATLVQEFLANYSGVLISDFYPGYDAVPCRQQKCWVHLIRDLNNDLLKAPYNQEFEFFVGAVKNLLLPILETIEQAGSKMKHLKPFKQDVDKFYTEMIYTPQYRSEITMKYQKRFKRYRESLFTMLEEDNIPWNNNMAERAIRQLAVQRKISGTFFKQVAPQYLRLLSMAQTCRFQNKSFLKFLLSQEVDVDRFKSPKPIVTSILLE